MQKVFVSIPFEPKFDPVFDRIRSAAAQSDLRAIRVDRTSSLADDIADYIRRSIRESRAILG